MAWHHSGMTRVMSQSFMMDRALGQDSVCSPLNAPSISQTIAPQNAFIQLCGCVCICALFISSLFFGEGRSGKLWLDLLPARSFSSASSWYFEVLKYIVLQKVFLFGQHRVFFCHWADTCSALNSVLRTQSWIVYMHLCLAVPMPGYHQLLHVSSGIHILRSHRPQ